MTSRIISRAFCAFLISGLLTTTAWSARTDVVVLVNGDEVTGEVEELEFGSLSYSTDSMGTVSIDWEDIVSLTANHTLQVEITDGSRFFGTLVLASDTDHIAVVGAGGIRELEKRTVIRMVPIESDESFFNRLEGSASLGFDTNKGSGVSTGRVNFNIRYRTQDYLVGISSNTTITDQPGAETTKRATFGVNYQRFRENRWFTDWNISTERNDEQGIENRASLGAGLGRFFVQTNKNQFSVIAGLVATSEEFTNNDPTETFGEASLRFRYLHRARDPDADITFTSSVFPRLDDFSNFRAETDLIFSREFIDDLTFDVQLYHTYLSDPPDGAESDDYGLVTSLGYSF